MEYVNPAGFRSREEAEASIKADLEAKEFEPTKTEVPTEEPMKEEKEEDNYEKFVRTKDEIRKETVELCREVGRVFDPILALLISSLLSTYTAWLTNAEVRPYSQFLSEGKKEHDKLFGKEK